MSLLDNVKREAADNETKARASLEKAKQGGGDVAAAESALRAAAAENQRVSRL
jgi:hypothetical protein